MKNNLKFNKFTAQERSSRDKIIGTTQHDLFIQTTPLIKLEKRQNLPNKATEISRVTFFYSTSHNEHTIFHIKHIPIYKSKPYITLHSILTKLTTFQDALSSCSFSLLRNILMRYKVSKILEKHINLKKC